MGSHSVQKSASPPLKDRRILVVADDQFIAGRPVGARRRGRVWPGLTVAEGAQLADYWPIEIALMDLKLGCQSADDLVVQLTRKDVKVVVVSGYDIKQQVAENAFATLTKPVTSAVLLDTLYRAASLQNSARGS